MLRKDPSFSIYNSIDGFHAGSEEEEIGMEKLTDVGPGGDLSRTVTIGDTVEAVGSGEFSFVKKSVSLIEEGDDEKEEDEKALNGFENLGFEEVARPASSPMYLATSLGIDGNGIAAGFENLIPTSLGDSTDVDDCYERIVADDPSNPLFLTNYGKHLQSKGHLLEAENCFYRATLADPNDGEILLQYAELVWELHHDKGRASAYFEQAAHVAPNNTYVQAAYTRFLWETGEDEEEINSCNKIKDDMVMGEVHETAIEEQSASLSLNLAEEIGIDLSGFGAGLGSFENKVGGFHDAGNTEEYLKKMAEENPCNPLVLRNYAQFLSQFKGDLQGAEKFYSRAMIADPENGETMSQYAKLVWQLYHDKDKASRYFEQAVQATPEDTHVLAAYASFLWDTEDDDQEEGGRSRTDV